MGYKKLAISGVKWSSASKITVDLLNMLQLVVVARYIDKADFGLMAIVHVVLGMTGMFTDLGMHAAMMHKQDITEKQYSSIYWFNWGLNVAVFLIVCFVAVGAGYFYGDLRLIHLIILTGVSILFAPFGKIFYTIKQKNMEFGFISKVTILTSVITFLGTLILAVSGFGIYSLIVPSLLGKAISAVVFSYAGRKEMRIQWHYNFAEIKDFFKIGIYDTGAQLMDYLSYKVDVLLVGKFFGMDGLGLYNMGKELALKTMKMVNPIITSVATPIFAKMQDSVQALKQNYLLILNLISFINFPILLALFVFADPVVTIFFSAKYAGAAPFVRILCFWGIFASIGNPAGTLVVAKGRTDLSFKWTIIRFLCAPPAVVIAGFFTINAVAYSQVILQMIFFFIYWKLLIYPLAGITIREYVGSLKGAFLCALCALIPSMVYMHFYSGHMLWGLILGCVLFGSIYLLSTRFLNKKMLSFFLSLVKK